MTNTRTLTDPRMLYPKPPFPSQPQPQPGLAQDMLPRPDHGESTYRGSGKLDGRRALVTGGQLVDITVDTFGSLDLLVINAGRQQYREKLEELTTADFDKTLKTNLYALHWTVQAAIPHMPPGSAILTTASIQAYHPSAILLDYATTKAGIVAYTKALAKQLIERGIRVNAVAPGPVWTVLQPSGGQPDEKVRNFGQDSDFGRPGQPAELAPVYVLLASQEASFINGEVYGVTGGKGLL